MGKAKPSPKLIFWLALGLVVAVVIIGYFVYLSYTAKPEVTNFAQCVAAGNPVQESYPEVCRTPNGQSFTNPNQTAPAPY